MVYVTSGLRTPALAFSLLALGPAMAQERPRQVAIADLAGKYLQFDGRGLFWTLTIRKNGTFRSYRFLGDARDIGQPREGIASVSNGSLFLVVPPGRELHILTPATFGRRLYLLPAGQELGFCIDIAQGREPRKSTVGEALLRQGDEKITVPKDATPDVCREP